MKVLVLGAGGREHAVAWKLARSKRVSAVFCGPGNGGTGQVATNVPAVNPLDPASVLAACRAHSIECVFVGPETPLAAGVVDVLAASGVPAIGPRKDAARLESSKTFSKSFLLRNSLPTARAEEYSDPGLFESRLRLSGGQRLVVKKSGLAAGKGVLESSDPAELLRFGTEILRSDRLLVEEFLEGWEVSIFGLSDGKSHVVLPPCTDFKKAHDGDTGPNTGGMGAICPVPWVDPALMRRIMGEVVEPTYAALGREGLDYPGILYFGLMITREGPKILEFNVRLGDPETQVLMPMLPFDLGEALEAVAAGTLGSLRLGGGPVGAAGGGAVAPAPGAALGVVVAGRGYPEAARSVAVESAPDGPAPRGRAPRALLFHASSSRAAKGGLTAGGGRCFTAVGLGADLKAASARAYEIASNVHFDGAWCRGDIGRKFLEGRP